MAKDKKAQQSDDTLDKLRVAISGLESVTVADEDITAAVQDCMSLADQCAKREGA